MSRAITFGDFIPESYKEKVKQYKKMLVDNGFYDLKDTLHQRRDSLIQEIDEMRKILTEFRDSFNTWTGRFPQMNKYRKQSGYIVRMCYVNCDDRRNKFLNKIKYFIKQYYLIHNAEAGTVDVITFVKEVKEFMDIYYENCSIFSNNAYENFRKFEVRMDRMYKENLGQFPLDMQKTIFESIVQGKDFTTVPTEFPVYGIYAQINKAWYTLMAKNPYKESYEKEKTQWLDYVGQIRNVSFECAKKVFIDYLSGGDFYRRVAFEVFKGPHTRELLRYHKTSSNNTYDFTEKEYTIKEFMRPILKREINRERDFVGSLNYGKMMLIMDPELGYYREKDEDCEALETAGNLYKLFKELFPLIGSNIYHDFCDLLGAFFHDYNYNQYKWTVMCGSDSDDSDKSNESEPDD